MPQVLTKGVKLLSNISIKLSILNIVYKNKILIKAFDDLKDKKELFMLNFIKFLHFYK